MQSESSIQKAILNILNARKDTWAVKTVTTNRNGTPDILACIRGRFVAIEVKTAKGVVAPLQHHQINLINNTGGIAMVARNTQEVKDMLTAIEKMAIQDGDFETLDTVDPIIREELIALRDKLEAVVDHLLPLLHADTINPDDIEKVLDVCK